MDMEKAYVEFTKSNQVGETKGMVYYFNFVLSEKNSKFYRIAYTQMDVLGEVGGLIEAVSIIVGILLIPFKYNLNNI